MKSPLDISARIFPPSCRDHVFLVGGCVRDVLLGRESRDIDLIAALSHEDLCSFGFRLVEASSSATIYFLHDPDWGKIEVTRIEKVADLPVDLCRRDFTINAMAMSMAGMVIDPLSGREDVVAGALRPCSPESFLNDPLRIIRAFRFEAGGWHMEPETERLITEREWATSFIGIPVERFSGEMLKALTLQMPERFFQLMIKFSAGEQFLPELFRMPHIPAGPLEHHPEGDLFTHSTQVLQRVAAVSSDPLARFCAFFHDLGKLVTAPQHFPKHHGHDTSGFRLAPEFCAKLRLPAAYAKALAWVSRLHGNANTWSQLRDSTKITMAEHALKAGITDILPLVSAADKPGGPPMAGWDEAVRVAGMNINALGVDQGKMQAIPISERQTFILQKRVDALRSRRTICLERVDA